ncbi:MAG TPA: nucleotidyltransferase family protein [Candidatus Paceibacterota bacterium]|nr:nucleotidyltransferase family protein [Verrucomicrobiota bacterium]HRY51410.1 nucleotidyltransferase family protein [Candidatus Paceibacterota bacterium]HSA01637.1 nucleotidyltransferase family protein [Candidatus Paceibacterota bacterium]
MKAVILAAGKGTRMRDLTLDRPKPMLPVQGKPILAHIVEGLANSGVRQFCIITGFKAEIIEDYFQNGDPWGVHIEYARQIVQNGTGKAAEPARAFVGNDSFLLTYGDILVRPETYRAMMDRFHQGDCAGLLTTTRGADVQKGGLLLLDSNFYVQQVVEKPSDQQLNQLQQCGFLKPGDPVWYNAGIYIFPSAVFECIAQLQPSSRGEYELTDAISALIQSGHRLTGLEIQGRWVDVRDPEVLASLSKT